jgi:hypothetical protein
MLEKCIWALIEAMPNHGESFSTIILNRKRENKERKRKKKDSGKKKEKKIETKK